MFIGCSADFIKHTISKTNIIRVLLWYPQVNNSHPFLSIQRSKILHTSPKNMTGMYHTGANFAQNKKKP
jgi:hypothetical protein